MLRLNSNMFMKSKINNCFRLISASNIINNKQQDELSSKVLRKRKYMPQEPLQSDLAAATLPTQAKVVICGGGITGASVAYHLAQSGWGKETVLLEQDEIGAGCRYAASGLASRFEPNYVELKLAEYSINLIKQLTQRGLPTGWRQVGTLNLARTFDRMIDFKRMKSQAVAWGVTCEILTPEQCKERCPILEINDLQGGLWIPEDGVCDPQLLTNAFVKEAITEGLQVVEHCAVKRICTESGRVKGVDTSAGHIDCDVFINCTGFWARDVGTLSKPVVKVPLKAVEHHYLHTQEFENLDQYLNYYQFLICFNP